MFKKRFPDGEIFSMIKSACAKLFDFLKPQAVFEEFDLKILKNDENSLQKSQNSAIFLENSQNPNSENFRISFADAEFYSKDLGRNLKNCESVYLTAATLGPHRKLIFLFAENKF